MPPTRSDPAVAPDSSEIGIVVIGRNEGERLTAALESVAGRGYPVVYVDSGSTDGSPARARQFADWVIELTADLPFTAARGRNEGHALLRARCPRIELVQFVDGDTVLDAGWIERAAAVLLEDTRLAAVAGQLDEGSMPASDRYARLLRMEWTVPPGEVEACGGIAMYRSDALQCAGGFASDLHAGEEPELCARLRRDGYRILRIGAPMGIHRGRIDSFASWWLRAVRAGGAALECAWRGGFHWAREDWRRLASALAWGGVFPGAVVLTVLGLLLLQRPMLALALVSCALGVYGVLWWRIRAALVHKGETERDARLFATYCLLSKPAGFLGAALAVWRRTTGSSFPERKESSEDRPEPRR